jgi:hypothetical protein
MRARRTEARKALLQTKRNTILDLRASALASGSSAPSSDAPSTSSTSAAQSAGGVESGSGRKGAAAGGRRWVADAEAEAHVPTLRLQDLHRNQDVWQRGARMIPRSDLPHRAPSPERADAAMASLSVSIPSATVIAASTRSPGFAHRRRSHQAALALFLCPRFPSYQEEEAEDEVEGQADPSSVGSSERGERYPKTRSEQSDAATSDEDEGSVVEDASESEDEEAEEEELEAEEETAVDYAGNMQWSGTSWSLLTPALPSPRPPALPPPLPCGLLSPHELWQGRGGNEDGAGGGGAQELRASRNIAREDTAREDASDDASHGVQSLHFDAPRASFPGPALSPRHGMLSCVSHASVTLRTNARAYDIATRISYLTLSHAGATVTPA